MKPSLRNLFILIAWLTMLMPFMLLLTNVCIRMHLGVTISADLNGTPFDTPYDEFADYWYSPVMVGTFIILAAAAYSGLLWGARDKGVFVPTKDMPESIGNAFTYGIAVACVNAALTVGMSMFAVFGKSESLVPMHPADMLCAAVIAPVLILMSFRTKRLAPAVWLFILYLSGQATILLSGHTYSPGAIGFAIFYVSGYATFIQASWRYGKLRHMDMTSVASKLVD